MDASAAKPLKDRLKEVMEERKINIPQLSELLDIKRDRMYKWYSEGNNPKADDAVKLEKWISGEMEESIISAESSKDEPPAIIISRLTNVNDRLSRSIQDYAEAAKEQAAAARIQAEAARSQGDAAKLQAENTAAIVEQNKQLMKILASRLGVGSDAITPRSGAKGTVKMKDAPGKSGA